VGGGVDGRAEIHVATGDCDRTAPDIDRLVERGGARTIHGQPAGGVDRAVENAVAGAGDHEPAGAGELPVHHDVARAVERDDAAVGGDGFGERELAGVADDGGVGTELEVGVERVV